MAAEKDPWKWEPLRAVGSARRGVNIAPSDDTDLDIYVRQIELTSAGGPGDVEVVLADNDPATESVILPIDFGRPITGKLIRRVKAAGTTATGLYGSI